MKSQTTYRRLNPDTVLGEKIQIIQTFSSFDKAEIDHMEEMLKKNFGCLGVVSEFDYDYTKK